MSPFTSRAAAMRGLLARPAMLGPALALLAACSPALNWREVRPPDAADFNALFPCKPEHAQRTVSLPGLPPPPVTLHIVSCEADGLQWAVSYLDAGSVERRAAALPALVRSWWGNVSMTDPATARRSPTAAPEVRGATEYADAQGWWLEGRRPVAADRSEPLRSTAWYFSRGNHVFQAAVWGPSLQNGDPRVKAFSEGFNFPR